MNRYCVIGSGISGATIANLLSKKYSVDVFDKARGPGGRSSFKRLDKVKGLEWIRLHYAHPAHLNK